MNHIGENVIPAADLIRNCIVHRDIADQSFHDLQAPMLNCLIFHVLGQCLNKLNLLHGELLFFQHVIYDLVQFLVGKTVAARQLAVEGKISHLQLHGIGFSVARRLLGDAVVINAVDGAQVLGAVFRFCRRSGERYAQKEHREREA